MENISARVRIVDVTPSFISFRYLSTNARCRIKRKAFINEVQTGKIEVENPQLLQK